MTDKLCYDFSGNHGGSFLLVIDRGMMSLSSAKEKAMRKSRLKLEETAYYHCMSRVIEQRYIMGEREKEYFVNLMHMRDKGRVIYRVLLVLPPGCFAASRRQASLLKPTLCAPCLCAKSLGEGERRKARNTRKGHLCLDAKHDRSFRSTTTRSP